MKQDRLIEKERQLAEQKEEEHKKEKKSLWIFGLILAASCAAGYVAGVWGAKGKAWLQNLEAYGTQLSAAAVLVVPALLVVGNLIYAVVCLAQYRRLKRRVADWRERGEEETELDQIEYRMNMPIIGTSVSMGLNFLLAAVNWKLGTASELSQTAAVANYAGTLFFLVGMAVVLVVQYLTFRLEKELNPEKRGVIFDVHFRRDWLGSCDEAERLLEYRAGFQAYIAGQYGCLVLWLVCVIGEFIFDAGLFPVLCVMAVWAVLTGTYLAEHMRLERQSRGIK